MSMRLFRILRVSDIEDGTFGVFFADYDIPFALTLERNWVQNKKEESCIPMGDYICQRIVSPKYGDVFEVINVPQRTHILVHKGNVEDDSKGCILIGEQFGFLKNKVAITHSGDGFNEFMNRLKGVSQFRLVIESANHVKKEL